MIYEKNKGVGERMSKNKIIQTNKRHYTKIISKKYRRKYWNYYLLSLLI